jgi:hypothetical protein
VNRVLAALLVVLPFLIIYVALGITTHDWGGVTFMFVIAVIGAASTIVCMRAAIALWERRS